MGPTFSVTEQAKAKVRTTREGRSEVSVCLLLGKVRSNGRSDPNGRSDSLGEAWLVTARGKELNGRLHF